VAEVREQLTRLQAEDLRLVAAQPYKMLPKKVAQEKQADHLLADPRGFIQAQSDWPAKAPRLPDPEWLGFETSEFLENAEKQNYFAPNRLIPKSERSQWRFLARRLYREWCLVATQPEHQAAALEALAKLYKILCRGCEVYLFPSTDTFRAVGVPQPEFLEQVLLLASRASATDQWIAQALALLEAGAHGDTVSAELQDVIVKALKTPDLKEAASETLTRQLGSGRSAARKGEAADWQWRQHRRNLLRLGFQIIWALGEKERAVQWLRTQAQGEDSPGHLVLLYLLETKDYELWMRTYEALRTGNTPGADGWEKTFQQAQQQGQLPAWWVT